jgi:hypothetical protein
MFTYTWGDVARGAHNSEGFALAREYLGDAEVTNLDMIQGPDTYRIWFIVDKVLVVLKATEIRIIWRFPEAAFSSEARQQMCFPKRPSKGCECEYALAQDVVHLGGFSVVEVF